MISLVDTTLEPKKPKLYLCKPNHEIVGILSEAYNITNYQKLGSINELTFSLPTQIDIRHVLTTNPNIELMKDRYHIKYVYDDNTEWYVTNQITSSMENAEDRKDVHCFSLGYELTDKLIRSYTATSLNASQVLQEVLAETIWDVGEIDADFDVMYRSFDIPDATVLDAVIQIADTFGALIHYDTINREIDFQVLVNNGSNRGLHFNYSKLLLSAESVSISDQMCTKLKCFGKDALTFNTVNPTGQNYIEDLSYFMTRNYATGKLIFSDVPITGETITIGGIEVYQFVTTSTSVTTGYIAVNLGDTFTIDNAVNELTQVLNRESIYVTALGNTVNNSVSVTSVIGGIGGNSTTITETCTNASWSSGTLSGGENCTDYMSTGLITALNNYNLLILSKRGDFSSYLSTKNTYEADLVILETAMDTLETELNIILDNIDVASASGESLTALNTQKNTKRAEMYASPWLSLTAYSKNDVIYANDKSYVCTVAGTSSETAPSHGSGTAVDGTVTWKYLSALTISKQVEIDNKNLQIKSVNIEITVTTGCTLTSDLTISIDGIDTTVTVDAGDSTSTVATKIYRTFGTIFKDHLDDGTALVYKSSVIDSVVTISYYDNADYVDLTVTFNEGTTGIGATVVSSNNGISNLISKLNNDLSIANNFTADEIIERNLFIIEKVWSDENYIDEQDLYNDALLKFNSMRIPQLSATIDIVNFLECIEEYRNWDKLNLGDYCTIYHEKLGMNISAKIIEMQFDFENKTVKLTIANVTDLLNDESSFLEKLNGAITSSTTLNMERYKYNGAYTNVNEVQSILNAEWDASLREIKAGVNESVQIDGRGITLTNPDDPNHAIRLMHNVIGVTDDGFESLGVAIDHTGVYAERLVGQIIAGVNLIITNEAGNFYVDASGVTITDMDLTFMRSSDHLVRTVINATDCFKIQLNTGTYDVPAWSDMFSVTASGTLTAEDLVANRLIVKNGGDVLIDAYNKEINFSNFLTIAGIINANNINLKGLSIWNNDIPAKETLYITASGNLTMQGTLKSSIIQAGVIQGMTSGTTGTTGLNLIYFGNHGGCIDTYTDEGTGYQALRLKPGVTVTGGNAGYVQYLEDGHIYFYDNSGSGVDFGSISPDGTTTLKSLPTIHIISDSTTLIASMAGDILKVNAGYTCTITIPANSNVPFPEGTQIEIIRYQSDPVSINGQFGVTLVSKGSYTAIASQFGSVALLKINTDEWLLVGDLGA